ncbi:SWIM zinc finger domain protein [Nitzschia inconspicua]|uniref:SWIM zinc finger domain protein n=1 Tax=Nitzschia inconspicua TaxID=303405 RepID=A0A9K3KDI8_9STRA|nr:SWIM zinc finger domain protein [Nitzschia inconspicua]
MANTNHLLDEIDAAVAALKVQKWTATLPFSGFLCKPTDDVLMASFQDLHDLFSFTQTIYKGFIVRFDPQTFPVVPGGVAKNIDSIKKLFDALMCASHHHGFSQLVSHNQNTAGRKYLCCANFQIHRQNTATKAAVGELRQSTLVCDRKNSRGPKGQSLPKRTSTSKATNSKETCKVKLAFDADSVSMFLVCGIGESQHEGHLPRYAIDMATRKRIVPAAATDFQKMSANHNIGPGKTAAMVEEEFGLHLTRRQVAQMQQMAKLADDLNDTDELEQYKHLDSDTDRVLAYLKKKGATYCVLYHGVQGTSAELVPQTQQKTKTEVGASDKADSGQLIWTERMDYIGNQGHVQCEVLADEEVFAGDLFEYASQRRDAVSARDDQHVLISLVWAMPIGKPTTDYVWSEGRRGQAPMSLHEQHFARCFYVDVRGFDAYSNTCLEGTNYGVKYCENRVLLNMSQAKATKVMINQDEDKFTQNRKRASDAFHKTPLQARTNTSAHVLQTAESMLQQAMVASESYISYRVCERKWWVLYSGHRNLPVRLLPVFARARTVSIDENNRMKCSCCEYERNGIPCKHICHVASKFGTNFESFTHHLVNIRFWTAYSLYAVVLDPSELNEDELNIRNKLVTTRWKSPQTPTAPASMKSMDEGRYSVGSKSEDKFMSMTGEDLFLYFQALMKNKLSILNYNIEHVEKAK